MKCTLKTVVNTDLNFGDYILFQDYKYTKGDEYDHYLVSKPILAIYLGDFVADQAIGFDYLPWYCVKNKYSQPKLKAHIEWDDMTNLLGHWNHKPTWKEIIAAYRKFEKKKLVDADEIFEEE